jgi:hypothetical protein
MITGARRSDEQSVSRTAMASSWITRNHSQQHLPHNISCPPTTAKSRPNGGRSSRRFLKVSRNSFRRVVRAYPDDPSVAEFELIALPDGRMRHPALSHPFPSLSIGPGTMLQRTGHHAASREFMHDACAVSRHHGHPAFTMTYTNYRPITTHGARALLQ